jgi:two-component system LytT family sensor kinase
VRPDRLRTAALALAGWTALGVFSASRIYLSYRYNNYALSWWDCLRLALPDWYAWGLLFPVIAWLVRRFPLEPGRWRRSLLVHVPAALALTVLKMLMEFGAIQVLSWSANRRFSPLLFHQTFLTYAAIVGLVQGFAYRRKYREHELRSSQLEARLAEAQLQVLRMQLQPHFLFNTLHAISALMHRDVEAADRMVSRLSELLRLTLESGDRPEVALRQELEFLESYLDIERTRFQDRLTVDVRADPETLEAAVPTLLLQPLVENAVRHGVAARTGPGRIEIETSRRDGALRIEVRDNGVGLTGGAAREGIGLANTRRRLEQLYGAAQRLELAERPGGGLVVSVSLPWRPAGGA